MRTYKINLILISIVLIAVSCSGPKENQPDKVTAQPESIGTVSLTDEQMKLMQIETGPVEYLNMAHTIETNGNISLPPQNTATLSAIIGGRVKAIHVVQGDQVKRGQTLAVLENPEYLEMQENYLTAKTNLVLLEKEYERAKTLREKEINSEKIFEKTESDLQNARFKFEGIKAQLELLGTAFDKLDEGKINPYILVKSPIDGYIRSVDVNIGKYVEVSDILFDIVDNNHLHLEILVYEQDIPKVASGQKIHFFTPSNPSEVFNGKIYAVGKAFEKDMKAVKVYADILDKKDYFMSGMYVNAFIDTDSNHTAVLPNSAITESGGKYYVFAKTVTTENEFRQIEISVGNIQGDYTEIHLLSHDLKDMIFVTNGAYYLQAELQNQDN